MVGSYGYSGNAFIYVDPDEVEIFNLKPQEVHVVASKSNFIEGYIFKRHGSSREVFIPPERMIHIKSFHPTSYFYGLSPLSAAWDSVAFLNFDDKYWQTFFKEGGRVMGVWSMENSMSEQEYDRLKEAR
jgi:phage portal protein BeeE